RCSRSRGLDVLPPPGGARDPDAPPRARPDAARRAGRAGAPAALEPPSGGRQAPLPVRDALAARGARAVDVCARRAPRAARVAHRRPLGGRSARRAGVHDRNMSRFFSRINPFLRGMLILGAIAAVIVVLQLEQTLVALGILARVAFILAIAYFIFLMWRERRGGVSMWPQRAQWVFYGAAIVAVADVGLYWYGGAVGYQILAFVAILVLCGFAMWRTWRDQHTYV